jgi:AcrR family transcriptional regulator
MAKEKVLDKEKAILETAIQVFAERGFWNTPTSLISKTAGIADGTLFTYFKTKDDLISEIYLEIKRELSEVVMDGFVNLQTTREKMWHVWERFIDWGVQNPERFNVLRQISTSYKLSDEVKAKSIEPFAEVEVTARESIARGEVRDYPVDYLGALMDSQSTMTVQFIGINPDQAEEYKRVGFDILWNGVTR